MNAGVYLISYEVSLLSYPGVTTVTATNAFIQTITIEPCSVAIVTVPTQLSNPTDYDYSGTVQ